jgi:hypothetical protein
MSKPERPGVSGDGEAAHMARHLRSAPSYELKLTLGTCCLSFGIGLSKKLLGRDARFPRWNDRFPTSTSKRSYKNYSGKQIGLANSSSFAIFKNCDPVR